MATHTETMRKGFAISNVTKVGELTFVTYVAAVVDGPSGAKCWKWRAVQSPLVAGAKSYSGWFAHERGLWSDGASDHVSVLLADIIAKEEAEEAEAVVEEAHDENEYATAFVSIEGFEPENDSVFEALVLMEESGHAEQWNGFAIPYLNRAAVEALIACSDAADGAGGCSVVKWDDDEHVILSIDNGFEDEDGESATLLTPDQIDGVDYWRMDIGWCWQFEALVHPTELMPTVGDFRALVENDGSVYAFEFVGGNVVGRLEFAAPFVWFEWMNLASVATNFDLSDYSFTTDEATRDAWNGSEAKDFTVMLLQRFNRYGGRFTYIADGMIGSKVK